MNRHRQQYDHTDVQHIARTDSHAVENTVESDADISGNADLVVIARPFLAGMHHDEFFHHVNSQETEHDREAHFPTEDGGNLWDHVEEHRPQQNPRAKTDEHAKGFLRPRFEGGNPPARHGDDENKNQK